MSLSKYVKTPISHQKGLRRSARISAQVSQSGKSSKILVRSNFRPHSVISPVISFKPHNIISPVRSHFKPHSIVSGVKSAKGPVIIAKPIPATKALNKKSSNIFYLSRLINTSIRKMLVIMFMLIKSKSGVNIFSK